MAKKKAKASGPVESPKAEPVVIELKDLPEDQLNEILADAQWGSEFTDALLAAGTHAFTVEAVVNYAELVFNLRLAKIHKGWIAEILSNLRVGIQGPPESAKSTVVSLILMSWWIGMHPETMNMILFVSDDQAQKIASAIANIIEFSPKWKKVFPSVVPDKARGWSRDGYYVKRADVPYEEWTSQTASNVHPTLTAGGIGSSLVIGKRVTGLLACDDLHDVKSKTSETVREQTIEFFKTTVSSRPTDTAHMVVIGNRWHPQDVFQHLEETGLYTIFTHPAVPAELFAEMEAEIATWPLGRVPSEERLVEWESEVKGKYPDLNSYWPKVWPLRRLIKKLKELGRIDFMLMYLCMAEAAQGQILKLEALRWFPFLSIKHTWQKYIGVDMALKMSELSLADEKKHSEFSLTVIAYSEGMMVVEDGYADLVYFGEAENTFFDFCDLHRPVRVGFEVNAQNKLYHRKFVARKVERGYSWLQIMPVTTTKDMATRMADMEPHFRNGEIQVSDRATPFLVKFKTQWLGFGLAGVKNDTLSSTHLAYLAAYNLLPKENAAEAERKRRLKPILPIGKRIEQAYGAR